MSFEKTFLNLEKNWVKNQIEGLIKEEKEEKNKMEFFIENGDL